MVKRNPHIAQLPQSYLFPEIGRRRRTFQENNPSARLISLGIGDTTVPISQPVASGLSKAAERLSTREGYTGYGPERGSEILRKSISERIYHGKIKPHEIFISDGAKCDLGRLQLLFGANVSVAIQDPAYPVYVDGSLMQGVKELIHLPCLPENDFFPQLPKTAPDLLYFCSPNNPTGAVASRAQLEELVAYAQKNQMMVIFDAAYSAFIQDPTIPKSIFEIPGARSVALEINSFSKIAGFTGVRLGWSVVPDELTFEDGGQVQKDWSRVTSTIFNGASNIAQAGGLHVLDEEGWQLSLKTIDYYLENAAILRRSLEELGIPVYGGRHAPYLWAHFPGKSSWEMFHLFLEKLHLVTTPGSGFGPAGEGFLRLTSFGQRPDVLEAAERFNKLELQ